ncbi:sensor histidine kinase [Roseibium polysiphoniae]|uniref:histidine kinase n=1 Tax=Roseibium polysiphoniae TaxID=2571221 RepID=A0ABR9CBK6_9HYPH|nr:HAMP domain-containing sensor histidine kinase [Roseibium polysiphoniae]MBD8876292.1 HAMP domain-containing histidine kinase [Roseibium polysiphoniae]
MHRIRRFGPQRIATQMLLIMPIGCAAMVMFILALLWVMRPEPTSDTGATVGLKHAIAVARLNDADEGERADLLEQMLAADASLDLTLVDQAPAADPSQERRSPFWPFQEGVLAPGISLVASWPLPNGEGGKRIPNLYFQLADGQYVLAKMAARKPPPFLGNPLVLLFITLGASLLLLLVWAARTLVRPLSNLSADVAKFGKDTARPVPVAEAGPREVQQVAQAINRMQGRIEDLVERRTRMLTAVGHDLRTPLTRLRLRIELMKDEDHKQRNLADLDLMEVQLNGALSFLKEGRTGEAWKRINLPSLLQGLVDQYEDMGVALVLSCPQGVVVEGRSSELTRACANLIDNARRYDDQLSLHVSVAGSEVHLDVVDHGPGIPAGDQERLMEPFERGDEARQIDNGTSFGLGLATTRAIAEAHGGRLELSDTPGGGLTARIVLNLG